MADGRCLAVVAVRNKAGHVEETLVQTPEANQGSVLSG
jgi:hypothetical protein